MSDAVEKVARAICAHEGHDPDELIPGDVAGWTWYTGHARDAIEAMRDWLPDEIDLYRTLSGSGRVKHAKQVAAMIDAALTPSEREG